MIAILTLFLCVQISNPSPSPETDVLYDFSSYPEPKGYMESSNLMQEAQDYNSFWIETM